MSHNNSRKINQVGFTLLETIVTLLVLSISVGIAGPSWDKFMHERRISKTEEIIMQRISQAQAQARRENRPVSFRVKTRDGIPLVSQHYSKDETNWEPLLDGLEIKPGQIEVFGQKDNLTITFNDKGEVTTKVPYTIKVAAPSRNAPISYRGCVVVWSLLGAKRIGSSPEECPTRKGASPAAGELVY